MRQKKYGSGEACLVMGILLLFLIPATAGGMVSGNYSPVSGPVVVNSTELCTGNLSLSSGVPAGNAGIPPSMTGHVPVNSTDANTSSEAPTNGMNSLANETGDMEGILPSAEFLKNESPQETEIVDDSAYAFVTGTESIISTGNPGFDKTRPRISGSHIVWQSNDNNSNYNIYCYDLVTGNETLVTPFLETTDQTAPAISGDHVVYEDNRNGKTDIYLYTISSGETKRLTGDAGNQHSPAISANYVVWQDEQGGNYLIELCNLATGDVRKISAGTYYQETPAISGDIVAWAEWRDDSYEISCYNISSGLERRITNTTGHETAPAVSGDRIVYQCLPAEEAYTNLRLYNLTTGEDIAITNSRWDHLEPQVSSDRVIWTDKRNYSEVFMFNLSDRRYTLVTPGNSLLARQAPAIDGNHVVWSGTGPGGLTTSYEIYLITLGEPEVPLVADFSAGRTQGPPPLAVNFTDTTAGSPLTWHWDFGDGNGSRQQNPSHSYAAPGLYTVRLTVSTPSQRSVKEMVDLIASGSPPSPAFTSNATSGPAPAVIAFSDNSTGYPTSWHWDFGDGSASTEQNPEHAYSNPGTYTVNLSISNAFGDASAVKTSYIKIVPDIEVNGHAEIPGLVITGPDQFRYLLLNVSPLEGCSLVDPGNQSVIGLTLINGTIIGEVKFVSDSEGFTWDTTSARGNVTGMILSGTVPASGLGDPDLDLCSLSYNVSTGTPSGNISLDSSVWAGVTPDDFAKYEKEMLKEGYAGIGGTAYSVRFRNKDPAIVGPAWITMSVRPYWVLTHGQRQGDRSVEESVKILRIGDDGLVEILDTEYVGEDPSRGLEYFRAASPHGLSTFTLATLTGTGNPLQLAYLSVSSRVNTNSGGGSGGGGGGGGYGGNSGLSAPASSPSATESVVIPKDSPASSSPAGQVPPSSPETGSISTGPASPVAPLETPAPGGHSGAVAASQTPGSSIFSIVLQGAVVISVLMIVVFSVYTRYRRDE